MRLARFSCNRKIYWGILKGKTIRPLAEPPYKRIRFEKKSISSETVRFLAPSCPTKIVCVGLNYRDHARELKMRIPAEPVLFLKPPSALCADRGKVIYPAGVRRLDYEGELAVVIRKQAHRISSSRISSYILGFTCFNDITARDIQKKDGQWTRAKSFDTFAPCGPWIETELDPARLSIITRRNEKIVQQSNTADFIFPVKELISFISSVMTLLPGDIISTGTPPGVGPLSARDRVSVTIDGIGTLTNTVSDKR